MKNLVYYSSLSGNTKKIAEAIAKSLKCEIKSINENVNLDDFDCVIFGFYVDQGFMNKLAQNAAKRIKNKKIGVFFTLGTEPNSKYAKDCMQKAKRFFENLGNEIVSEFCSQGAISPKVIEQIRQMAKKMGTNSSHQITPKREKRWLEAAKHPNDDDIKGAINAFSCFNDL